MRQIRRGWRDIGRSRVAFEKILRSLVIRICAHGPEEIPEASPLAASGLDHAIPRQHRHTLLRRRRRCRRAWRVAASLVMHQHAGCRFRDDAGLRGSRTHFVAGSPSKQGRETTAVSSGRRRRRGRRCRRLRRWRSPAGQREVRRIICGHTDRTDPIARSIFPLLFFYVTILARQWSAP